MEDKFKMDRSVFSMGKLDEQPNDFIYWNSKTYTEKLEWAHFLINHAYGFGDKEPEMDIGIFEARKSI